MNSDSISRQYAIKRFGEDGTWLERQGVITLTMVEAKQRAVDILESLPSEDRPTGKWIEQDNGYFFCSKCGKYPEHQVSKTDFCPNCGTKMEV